ncbi:hypothetical protein GP486_008457 [Trichoglossum hirsutum]|uniref:Uncharacterized protein n=1 Tax=Trichoglossum hirsutum TaxID=265104 RepID=A0A9P8I3H1_9PEZI|nr:hypothetical protein GP486_008457 [Trichoglossum hirsutum]
MADGIFRFVNPTHGSVGAPPAGKGNNGGSDNEDGDEDNDGDSVGPIEFLIPVICHPSPISRTWPFRWRGTETDEGEIQLYSDKKLCSFTFLSAYGLEIKEMFESDYTEKIGFTGMKVVTEWHMQRSHIGVGLAGDPPAQCPTPNTRD